MQRNREFCFALVWFAFFIFVHLFLFLFGFKEYALANLVIGKSEDFSSLENKKGLILQLKSKGSLIMFFEETFYLRHLTA